MHHPQIDAISKSPGTYEIVNPNAGTMFYIEVTDEGIVHQLEPDTMTRDGVLSPDGWNHRERFVITKLL